MATILVVDDNAQNRLLLTKLLGAFDHEVVEAADGREGLDAARHLAAEGRLDVVLLDLDMPVLDGYGFLAEATGDPAIRPSPPSPSSSSPPTGTTRYGASTPGPTTTSSNPTNRPN